MSDPMRGIGFTPPKAVYTPPKHPGWHPAELALIVSLVVAWVVVIAVVLSVAALVVFGCWWVIVQIMASIW